MIYPTSGPFLFDTSAESWFARVTHPGALAWMRDYLSMHTIHLSAVTVLERVRGYSLLWRRARAERREHIEAARIAYLSALGTVWPLDAATAIVAGEIIGLVPAPPTPPRQSHNFAESRQDRLARWRFDAMIAATALITNMPLVHNNAADFETIRSAIEVSPKRFPAVGSLQLIRCGSLTSIRGNLF